MELGKDRQMPSVAIVVVLYEMYREAPRTLHTLSTKYQQGVSECDYQVIVIDNGSSERRSPEAIAQFGPNFSYQYIEQAERSPAAAINRAIEQASADIVGVLYDGARMLSPGLVSLARQAVSCLERPLVVSLGWHLGPDVQFRSMKNGYDRDVEDQLLERIVWQENGYDLFTISALAGSNEQGWFGPLAESPLMFMEREKFLEIGGYHSGFSSAAGGLLNLDIYRQACEFPGTQLCVLLGEGTFHQIHGGEINNATDEEHVRKQAIAHAEYEAVRGRPYAPPQQNPLYFGYLSEVTRAFISPEQSLPPEIPPIRKKQRFWPFG